MHRSPAMPRPQIPLLLSAVFLAYLAQMTLNPIIAPLAREVGLAEWQVGVTISTAAVMVVATSQLWGRRSQSWGRRAVLVAALALAAVTMTGFAVTAAAGMRGALTGTALFALFVLLRGIGFGTAIAAIPPTAQAFIADVTPGEAARVKGMAGVGAVQGVAMMAGAVVGGALAGFGLLTPLIVVPALLVIGLGIVAFGLRREPRHERIADPPRVRVTDPRVWPFLLTGFGMMTALGCVQVIAGFIVQDRFGLDAARTGLATGAVLLVASVGMVVAQAVIVPCSGWAPARLLRVGTAGAVAGFLILIPNIGAVALAAAMLLIGLGLGIATPGYSAGPSLLMRRDEQGALAGLIGATNGLTFVVAPTVSTALYGIWHPLPVILGTVIMAGVFGFVCVHPSFRQLVGTPTRG